MGKSKHKRSRPARRGGVAESGVGRKVAALAELLLNAERLADINDYFERALVSDDAFMRASKPGKNAKLTAVLAAVLGKVAPGGELSQVTLLQLRKHRLWHGMMRWGGGHAAVLYFEGNDIGLCCYARSLTNPDTSLMRFSVANLAGPTLAVGRVTRGQA